MICDTWCREAVWTGRSLKMRDLFCSIPSLHFTPSHQIPDDGGGYRGGGTGLWHRSRLHDTSTSGLVWHIIPSCCRRITESTSATVCFAEATPRDHDLLNLIPTSFILSWCVLDIAYLIVYNSYKVTTK